ncbi:efflux RND transporter periplasmic adaptor subunit [bacterium]|nr:efflux RND transporter periplasmic adaptor subunit [bacterium]
MKKYFIIAIISVLFLILGRFLYSGIQGRLISKSKNQNVVPDVTVQTIKNEPIVRSFEASGRVVSKYQVSIIARVAGYLQKSYFAEGSYVKAGDTLFLIEPDEYKNSADIAKADIKDLKAQLVYANKQLERAKELVKNDFIAKAKYDELLANRDALQARLKAADSSYVDKKRNLSYTNIKAPVDGRIGTIDVTVGNYVGPSSGSLTTINSTNPIYVTFPLSADNFHTLVSLDNNGSIQKRKVELFFTNGEKYKYEGVQDFSDNEVDVTTGTVTLRATFKNPENRLLHGQLVKVKIYASSKVNVPVVPITAVQENQEGKYVYVLDDKNIPQLRYIKTDAQAGYNYIVTSGLKAGDVIVKDGVVKVIPNNPVHITNN